MQMSSAKSNNLVELESAFVSYSSSERVALPNLSLQAGQELALVGKSGSGKSTTLHALAGLLIVRGAVAMAAGTNLGSANEQQLEQHRRHVALLFQDFYLLEGYSALENVVAAHGFSGQPLGNAEKLAQALLERVEMTRFAAKPHQLSTGERQRVALARALAGRPKLVLADEPTAHLDARRSSLALALLRELCAERGAALIVATHDPMVVEAIGQKVEFDS
jgi:putative ABC transport system ATP-binding protein